MKKLSLIAILASTAIASSAFAEDFYVRADAGVAFLPKQSSSAGGTLPKLKRDNHFAGSLGVGMNVMDNLRAELVLGNHFSAKHKTAGNMSTNNTCSVQHKLKATSLMLKGAVDVYSISMVSIYVNGGIGMARVSNTYTESGTDDVNTPGTPYSYNGTAKSGNRNNVAYMIGAGLSFGMSDIATVDLGYAYTDLGKTKSNDIKYSDGKTAKGVTALRVKTHDISLGLRFAL